MIEAGSDLALAGGTLQVPNAHAMRCLGELIGEHLAPGDVLLLDGDLGAGKTTLTQGIGRGLGHADPIQSPTFTLVNEHRLVPPVRDIAVLNHVDLYRLAEPDLAGIGFDDLLDTPGAVTVVEWPERAAATLPADYLLVAIEPDGTSRRVRLAAAAPGSRSAALRAAILAALATV